MTRSDKTSHKRYEVNLQNLNSTHRTRDTIIQIGVFSGNKTNFVRLGHI